MRLDKVAILADSCCDLPPELQRRYGIFILNYRITLDGETYQERVDFTPSQYCTMLGQARTAPRTEAISVEEYFRAFKKCSEEGYSDVIAVTTASSVSQTNSNAHLALTHFYAQCHGSRMRLYIIDSKLFSMAYGYPLCVCAAMLQQGTAVKDAVAYLEDCFSRIEIVFGAYTLKYLKMSGRTKGFSAFVGDLLHKRSMMSYIDGISRLESSVTGDKNLIPAMCAYAARRMDKQQPYLVGTTSRERAGRLVDECARVFGYQPQMVFEIGPSLVSHLGPEGDAIVFSGASRTVFL